MNRHPRTGEKLHASHRRAILTPRSRALRAVLISMLLASVAIPPSHPVQAAEERLRIVVAGPFTGPQAARTASMSDAALDALKRFSSQEPSVRGSLVPYPLGEAHFSLMNDACDAAVAEVMAKRAVAQGADLVLGHPCAKAAIAAARIYAAAGVTFIATETWHPDLTGKRAGPSIFRLSGRDDGQGADAADYLAEDYFAGGIAAGTPGAKPVAIVHDRTFYAKTIAEHTAAALKAKKIETVTGTIVAGDKQYAKLIAKIKDARAVFFAGFPMEAGFVLAELRAAGSIAPFLATANVATPEFAASFPQTASSAIVLSLDQQPQLLAARVAAAVAVYARARTMANGPIQGKAGERNLINAMIARSRNLSDRAYQTGPHTGGDLDSLGQIAFDAAGNASITSFGLIRWSGRAWEPVRTLR